MIKEWNRPMIEPSYSIPLSVLKVIGEKVFQTMLSQILMAMKREIPEFPRPYPLDNNSSNNKTIIPAKVNWMTIKIAFPAPIFIYIYITLKIKTTRQYNYLPIDPKSPYIPDQTYAIASHIAMSNPSTLLMKKNKL